MKWRQARRSSNVQDRRGQSPRMNRAVPIGGGAILLLALVSLLLGGDPAQVIEMVGGAGGLSAPAPQPSTGDGAASDEAGAFVGVVLADTEDTWGAIFQAAGQRYPQPKLVLFTDAVQSACGMNSTATGPFYCPGDQQVYMDLAFFRELHQMGAPGDSGSARATISAG